MGTLNPKMLEVEVMIFGTKKIMTPTRKFKIFKKKVSEDVQLFFPVHLLPHFAEVGKNMRAAKHVQQCAHQGSECLQTLSSNKVVIEVTPDV